MTSAINPNNIDGAYPVAGQDNDSQGFRDNFTNTKTNFAYAAAEITDLQNNAVLKGALSGTTLNNNMNGSILSNAQLQDMSESIVELDTVSSGSTQTIDYSVAPYYTLTTSGPVTLTFTNFPTTGTLGRVRVRITTTAGHTLTLPSAVSLGTGGVQGYSSNVITFNASGTYEFEFETIDAGTTIIMFDRNRPLNVYTNPLFLSGSEDLADAGAANLSLTTSYFTTAAAETSTLAAGTTGQIKVLAAVDITSGDMVTTVTNAGWKSSGTGTITFDEIGQTVTLMYINSKWFVIGQGAGSGNNFAQFA